MIGCGLGNILTAFIVARFFGAKKPTEFGSGNPGTANVGAVLGKKAGMLVYLGDAMKTLVAMLLVFLLFRNQTQLAFLYCSLGLTIGHDFPIWNHFKGGKGVAVSGIFILFINFKNIDNQLAWVTYDYHEEFDATTAAIYSLDGDFCSG